AAGHLPEDLHQPAARTDPAAAAPAAQRGTAVSIRRHAAFPKRGMAAGPPLADPLRLHWKWSGSMKLDAWARTLATATAAVLIAGCGGGGSGPAPDPEAPPAAPGAIQTSYQLFKESGLVPQPTRRFDNARAYL